MAATKTTYKVVAPAGVYVRKHPEQTEDNFVRVADFGERLVVLEVGTEWLKTEDGYVMNQPYIVEPDLTTTKTKTKKEAE
jgi:hypothetical protein